MSGRLPLPTLLSQGLVAFTVDFEAESRISLTISANTLEVLDTSGVRVRELPRETGISKEGNAMAVGFRERHGCIEVIDDPSASRGKVVRLTVKGQAAQAKYHRMLSSTEDHWSDRFGAGNLKALRQALGGWPATDRPERVRRCSAASSPTPMAGGPQARPAVLPHYPMVLHRGGYPDGS